MRPNELIEHYKDLGSEVSITVTKYDEIYPHLNPKVDETFSLFICRHREFEMGDYFLPTNDRSEGIVDDLVLWFYENQDHEYWGLIYPWLVRSGWHEGHEPWTDWDTEDEEKSSWNEECLWNAICEFFHMEPLRWNEDASQALDTCWVDPRGHGTSNRYNLVGWQISPKHQPTLGSVTETMTLELAQYSAYLEGDLYLIAIWDGESVWSSVNVYGYHHLDEGYKDALEDAERLLELKRNPT